ncbi:multidrug effflux MFS transporter [Nioella aestuarii]|uniref:multidrug effflux MFS transporter n=1 Tax=Nioella aestuarii TaxID=1662864 RepID=UPI003D7FCF6F
MNLQPPTQTPPRFWTLVMLTALAPLTLNMILPSLPAIADEFGVSYATANLALAGYLGLTAFIQIIAGPLSDRFGRRPVVLVALAIFALASGLCYTATSFPLFLTARLMQGAIISCFAMTLAITRDTHAREEAAARIGLLAMSMAIAPMLGPMVGGAVEAAFGWRAIFLGYGLAGVGLFVWCWTDLGETASREGGGFRDMAKSFRKLLRLPRFWGYAVTMMFSTGTFFIFLAGAPLVAGQVFGLGPAMVGVAVGSVTLGFLMGSFLSSRLSVRAGVTRMMLAGRVVATTGVAVGLGLTFALGPHLPVVFVATLFVGAGNGLTMPNSHAGAMSVAPELAGSIAGITGALTVAAGGGLSWLTGVLMTPARATEVWLAILLGACLIGLSAATWLRQDEKKTAPEGAA